MANVKACAGSGGIEPGQIVKANVIPEERQRFARMNEIYRSYFPDGSYPARTTIRGLRWATRCSCWKSSAPLKRKPQQKADALSAFFHPARQAPGRDRQPRFARRYFAHSVGGKAAIERVAIASVCFRCAIVRRRASSAFWSRIAS